MNPPGTATAPPRDAGRRQSTGGSLVAMFARWKAWDVLREAARQFRMAWIAVPAFVKIRAATVAGVGFVGCIILTLGLTFAAKWWAPRGLAAWDERVLRALDEQKLMSVQNAVLLESFGNLAYLIPLVGACAYVAARKRRPLLAIAFVTAYVLARPIVAAGWWLWDRQRPTIILDGRTAPPLHSFPSGHVVLAMSVYGLLAYLWVRASRSWTERIVAVVLFALVVTLTGIARLRLGTHWPSDVIAGAIIGTAWLIVVLCSLHGSRDVAP